nr:hypothetical protein [Povalibacter uvarum]
MLLGDPQRVFADHQIPAHRGVPRVVCVAVTHFQSAQGAAPTDPRVLKVADGVPVRLEEQFVVLDLAGELEPGAQVELALQDFERPRTELDDPILTRLRAILVARHHARLRHADLALHEIAVGDEQGDLLGRTEPREEPELIVVALRLAPIRVDAGNDCLRLIDGEGIDRWTILLRDAKAFQPRCGVMLLRVVLVAILERTAQRADVVVVRLL